MKRSILLNALACSALLLGGCSGKGSADSTKSAAKNGEPKKLNPWSTDAEIAAAEEAKAAKNKKAPPKPPAKDAPPKLNAWSTDEQIAAVEEAKAKKAKPAPAKAPPKDAPPKLNAWSTDEAIAAAEAAKKKKKG